MRAAIARYRESSGFRPFLTTIWSKAKDRAHWLALGLLVGVGIFSYWNTSTLIAANNSQRQLRTLLNEIEETRSMVVGAETGQRGYLLVGEKAYLESYENAALTHEPREVSDEIEALGVELEFEVDPLLPTLFCDPEKAGRVLINLTTNAIKFCGRLGHVRLSCHRESDGTGVTFGVSDDGTGISAENQEAIFRRFKQLGDSDRSSTKGFGLGLSIAKQLVELNLGDITVESHVGSGSTFFFTLPPADPREVLRRYLKWIERRRNGSSQLALVQANVEDSTSVTLTDDVNLFLNHLLRSTDLLFRSGPTQWLVVLPVTEIEVDEFPERVAKKMGDANRKTGLESRFRRSA
ncbi:MAG TPA: ATP-binding protein [Planctomycetaceae bacterium]|nr:ATP-binding protein [Planctomycetaceae bacterium]